MKTDIIGFRPAERPAFPSHVQWSGEKRLLSLPECEFVRAFAAEQTLSAGTIGNGDAKSAVNVPTYRSVETCALVGSKLSWLYERIRDFVTWANNDWYRFTLTGIGEPISYLKYTPKTDAKPAGHYNWHQDFGGGPYSSRKLSLVVQLSDPATYKGCRLQLCNDGPWEPTYIGQGDAILFPSWTPHCVTDIEEGVREALVVWVSGPQFQ